MTGGHFTQQWGREPEVQIVIKREKLASTVTLAIHLTLGPHHSLLAIHHLSIRLLVQLLRGRIPKDSFQTTRYITKPLGKLALRLYSAKREPEWDFDPKASTERRFGEIRIS